MTRVLIAGHWHEADIFEAAGWIEVLRADSVLPDRFTQVEAPDELWRFRAPEGRIQFRVKSDNAVMCRQYERS